MELHDTYALVTGAAKRVGRQIALALAKAGANLAIHYNRSAEEAGAAAEEIRSLGRRAELFQADLSQPQRIAEMFQAVAAAFGRVDVLVNSAATYGRTPIETLTADQWDAEFLVAIARE